MKKKDIRYQAYVQILKEELVPAMGCTEPIAIAYCAARTREVLGVLPERSVIEVSPNIVKNVKSVIVPNTDGLKGIETAVAAGYIAGDAEKSLEVISNVSEEQKNGIREYLAGREIVVKSLVSGEVLDIVLHAYAQGHEALVRITGDHTNIVRIEKDRHVLYDKSSPEGGTDSDVEIGNRDLLYVESIVDFANTADLDDVSDLLERQIVYNSAISEEGLKNPWGANIGKVLLKTYGDDIKVRARAAAAAGSDARMSGCEMPVIIISGSGNQGMAVSLPVIEYAKELNSGKEQLYRALLVADLVTVHLKSGIGKLSAYCGAVSAGCGAGCGIAYLHGGDFDCIAHTLVNALAIVSGIICDGAKPSCAAKIAAAVDAGILGFEMYQEGQQFYGGDGIISKGVENTIRNIGDLGSVGMKGTDQEIIRLMTENAS